MPICSFQPWRALMRNTAAMSQRSRHSSVSASVEDRDLTMAGITTSLMRFLVTRHDGLARPPCQALPAARPRRAFAALKRRTTFSRRRDTGPSKPSRHKLPQKVIEPTENTAPPEGVSKYTISARLSSFGGSPETVCRCDKSSSGTVTKEAGGSSERARITAFSGVPSVLSARSISKPAAPPPERP